MPGNTYLLFPRVIGNSKDRVHLGWFDLLSWSVGSQQGSPGGRDKLTDLSLEVKNDEGVVDLVKAAVSGKPFDKVTLDATRQNSSLFLRYEFKDVTVAS
jgi:type VI protein secretion system component Hcp